MTGNALPDRDQDHIFQAADQRRNERRTWIVIGLTASTMVLEIAAGLMFGSMALLADGWHMASHAAALSIAGLGYYFARRYARDPRFSFGTGKFGDLAAFCSALVLAFTVLLLTYESVKRLLAPVSISFDQAIAVAVLGLIVNLACAFILKERPSPGQDRHADHNLKAAYVHVLTDALTSVLAIAALSAGRFLGWVWLDPVMGLVGAVIIARWSVGLLRQTGLVLLDATPNQRLADQVRRLLEAEPGSQVADLHLWRVGPGHFAAIVSMSAQTPRPPAHYKGLLSNVSSLSHVTVEVNPDFPAPDQMSGENG